MAETRIGKGDFSGEIHIENGVVVVDAYPCSVRAKRAAMTDDEFWQDVSDTLGINTRPEDLEALELDECFGISAPSPCPECGSTVACGYDSEGRPMMHIVERDDD